MTRRLRLEPIGPEHAQDVWLLYQDPAVVKWVAGPWSPEQAKAFAVGWRRKWEHDSVGKWMAYLHDGTVVGRGGLSRMPPGARSTTQVERLVDPCWRTDRLEIGWALRREFHGQGYASEIGREGLAFAKEVLASRAVVSFTERHNIASRRVMERIGMIYTGEILWRGLVEGQVEEHDDAPFAVYVADLADPWRWRPRSNTATKESAGPPSAAESHVLRPHAESHVRRSVRQVARSPRIGMYGPGVLDEVVSVARQRIQLR